MTPERTLAPVLLDIRIGLRIFESAARDMVTDMVENRTWDSRRVGLLFDMLQMANIVLVWALAREKFARPYIIQNSSQQQFPNTRRYGGEEKKDVQNFLNSSTSASYC